MAGTWRDAKCKLPRSSSPSTENVADTEKGHDGHERKTLIVCERCHVAIHAGRPTRTHEDQEEPIKG